MGARIWTFSGVFLRVGGGVLAFEVVKSGDSDFWLWRGRNKKRRGHGASRAEQAVGEQAGESSRAE